MRAQEPKDRAGTKIVVEMWTDLGCPWCYIGKHRLRAALGRRPDADRFVIKLRSFELNPNTPREPETIESAFIRSHGGTADHVLRAERQIQALAHSEGLPFSLERLNANTFDIHRVVQYANEQGLGFEFFSGAQDKYFAGELNPFDPDALVRTAEVAGLSGQRVREILAGEEYAEATHADREEGQALGLRGVPFVVADRRFAAPGAQSVEVYEALLAQAIRLSSSAGLS